MTFLPSSGSRGHEQLAEARVELGELRLPWSSISSCEVLAHLGVVLAGEQLARLGEVGLGWRGSAVCLDDGLQLGVTAAGVARGRLVAGRVDLRQAATRASPARPRAPRADRTCASQAYRSDLLEPWSNAVDCVVELDRWRRRRRRSRHPRDGGERVVVAGSGGWSDAGLRAMAASITGSRRRALSCWSFSSRSRNSGSTSAPNSSRLSMMCSWRFLPDWLQKITWSTPASSYRRR